ncbi:Transcription factor MYB98 [Hondaea fermentalgiana]|uniref:Transcription factor MYB98 n=1 Tax=Hondaea fermentalgiana TaxID=2315210 RepID=A0A2R5GTC9_9STRA|nr:Transcription factor MYB98 [Hondaea fermentalgiana]|eukprot:GBG34090.1 Transcription factor MYB98 [Hondaea fermentalgiana]
MPSAKKLTWSNEEDVVLKRVLAQAGVQRLSNGAIVLNGSWGDVATHLPGRSAKQCRERWRFNLCPDINKSEWSCEEDATLIENQLKVGNQWALIARQLDGRTENSVKIRFKSILRASRRVWTAKDDADLMALHKLMGSKWSIIAERMPNRTRNGVKTRFLVLRNGVSERPLLPGAAEQLFRTARYADLVERFIESAGVRKLVPSSAAQSQPQANTSTSVAATTPLSPQTHALQQQHHNQIHHQHAGQMRTLRPSHSDMASPQTVPLPDMLAPETRHPSFASEEFAEDERQTHGAMGKLSRSSSKRSAPWMDAEALAASSRNIPGSTLSSPDLGPLNIGALHPTKRSRSAYPEGADESLLDILAPHANREWRLQRQAQQQQQQQQYHHYAPQQQQQPHAYRQTFHNFKSHSAAAEPLDAADSIENRAPPPPASSSLASSATQFNNPHNRHQDFERHTSLASSSSSMSRDDFLQSQPVQNGAATSASNPGGLSSSTLQLALALANSDALLPLSAAALFVQEQRNQHHRHGDDQRVRSLLKLY